MPLNIGVIGCGNISPLYLKAKDHFPQINYVALSDLDMELARARAAEFGIPEALTVDEILARDDIDLIVNLTVPSAHAAMSAKNASSATTVHATVSSRTAARTRPLGTSRPGAPTGR